MSQGSITIDIQAQIVGYQQEIEKVKQALSKIKVGSSIGNDLKKQLSEAERQINNLSKTLEQRVTSETQLDRLFDKFNNINLIFKNIGSGLQQVPWDEVLGGATVEIENVSKQINTLTDSISVSTSHVFDELKNKIPELQNVMDAIKFDPKSMQVDQFIENLDAAIDDTKNKLKELEEEQNKLNNIKLTANQKVAAAEQLGTVLSNEGITNTQIKTSLGANTNADINKILTESLQNNIEQFKTSLMTGLASDKRAQSPELIATITAKLEEKFNELETTYTQEGVNKILNDINSILVSNTLNNTGFGTQIKGLTQKTTAEWRELLSVMPSEDFIAKVEEMANKLEGSTVKEKLEQWIEELSHVSSKEDFKAVFESIVNAIRLGAKEIQNAGKEAAGDIAKAQEELEKLSPRIKDLETSKTAYESVKTSAQPEIEAALKEINSFRSRIEDLERKVNDIKTEQNSKASPLSSAGEDIKKDSDENFNNATAAASMYKDQLEQVRAREQMIGKIEGVVQRWFSIYAVVRMVSNAIRSMISTIQELDATITEIAIVTKMDQTDLWGQMGTYTDMAREYAASISGVYKVSQLYYQQGLQTTEVMSLTEETLKMARISGLDYAQATDYMTNAVRSFKMEMSEASTVVDVYSAVAASSATSVTELASAMSKTASSAQAVGSSFENTTAMMAVMIEATRESAENIGSAMKSIISRYGEMTSDPSALVDSEGEEMSLNRVDKALQTVGISIHNTAGEFRNFDDVIMELAEAWNTIDTNTQRYIATTMAGNRQQSRFLALVSSYDRLKELSETAADSEDAAQQQYLKTLDSVAAKTQQLQTSLQSLYTEGGLEKLYKSALDFANNIVLSFNNIAKAADTPLAAIAKFGTLFYSIANVVTTVFGLIKKTMTNQMAAISSKAHKEIESGHESSLGTMKNQEAAFTADYNAQWDSRVAKAVSSMNAIKNAYTVFYQDMMGVGHTQTGRGTIPAALPGQTQSGYTTAMTVYQSQLSNQKKYPDSYIQGEGNISEEYTLPFSQRFKTGIKNIPNKIKSKTGKIWSQKGITQASAITSVIANLIGSVATMKALSMGEDTQEERSGKALLTALGSTAQGVGIGASVGGLPGAIIGGVVGLVSGIVQAVNIAHESIDEQVSRLTKESTDANNTYIKSKSEAKEIETTIENLEKLKEKRNDSIEDMEAYQDAMNKAAESYPSLVSYYDEEGNAVIELANSYAVLAGAREQASKDAKNAAVKSVELAEKQAEQARQNMENTTINYTAKDAGLDNYKDNLYLKELDEKFNANVSNWSIVGLGNQLKTDTTGDLSNNIAALTNALSEKRYDEVSSLASQLNFDEVKDETLLSGLNLFQSLVKDWQSRYDKNTAIFNEAERNVSTKQQLGISSVVSEHMQTDRLAAAYANGDNVDYLSEFDNASQIINSFIADSFKQLEGISYEDFLNDNDIENGFTHYYTEITSQIKEFWDNQTTQTKDQFNELISSQGNYTEDQYISKLEEFGILDIETGFGKTLLDSFKQYAYTVENFNKAMQSNGRDQYAELQDIITGAQEEGLELGGDEWKKVLSTVDTLITQQKGSRISENASRQILSSYMTMLSASDSMQELQTIISSGDIFSLEGLNTLKEKLINKAKELGQTTNLEDSGILDEIDDLKSLIYVNISTALDSLLNTYAQDFENFDKDISAATSGMDFKAAVEMAQKLGKNLTDFNYQNGKYYYDNLSDLENYYHESQKELETDLKNRVEQQKEWLSSYEEETFISTDKTLLDLLRNAEENNALSAYTTSDAFKDYDTIAAQEYGITPDYLATLVTEYLEEGYSEQYKDIISFIEDIGKIPMEWLDYLGLYSEDIKLLDDLASGLEVPDDQLATELSKYFEDLPEGLDINTLAGYIKAYRDRAAEDINKSFSEWIGPYLDEQTQAIRDEAQKYYTDQQARSYLSKGNISGFLKTLNITDTNGIVTAAVASGDISSLPAEIQEKLKKYTGLIYETFQSTQQSVINSMIAAVGGQGTNKINVTDKNIGILQQLQKEHPEWLQGTAAVGNQLTISAEQLALSSETFIKTIVSSYDNITDQIKALSDYHKNQYAYNNITGLEKVADQDTFSYDDLLTYYASIGQDLSNVNQALMEDGLAINAAGEVYVKNWVTWLNELTMTVDEILSDSNASQAEKNNAVSLLRTTQKAQAAAAEDAYKNIFNNYNKVSTDQIEALANVLETDYEVIESYFIDTGDSSYKLNLGTIQNLLAQGKNKVGEATYNSLLETVTGIQDSILSSITSASKYTYQGTNSVTDMQKFVNSFNTLLPNSNLGIEDAFSYDTILNTFTLNANIMKRYTDAQKEELAKLGLSGESIDEYIKDQTVILMQQNLSIEEFLNAQGQTQKEKTGAKLAQQIQDLYKANGERIRNTTLQQIMSDLDSGGLVAVNAIKELKGEEVTTSELEAAFNNSQIVKLRTAMSDLEKGVGETVTGLAMNIMQVTDGFELVELDDGSAVITAVGDMVEAYANLYAAMEKNTDHTTGDLNNAYAKLITQYAQSSNDLKDLLSDAATGISADTFGTIMEHYGLVMKEVLESAEGIVIDQFGNIIIQDFKAFENWMNNNANVEWNSNDPAFKSLYNSYIDSKVEILNRPITDAQAAAEQLNNILNAKKGEAVNISYLDEFDKADEKTKEVFEAILQKYGAAYEDGILIIGNETQIPNLVGEIGHLAQEAGIIIPEQLAELEDAIVELLDNIVSLLSNGVNGSLSHKDALTISNWYKDTLAQREDYADFIKELDFSDTAEGLQLTETSLANIYELLKGINAEKTDAFLENIISSKESYQTLTGALREFNDSTNITNTAARFSRSGYNGTVDVNYNKRPHIINADGSISTVESLSSGNGEVEVLVTPILPDGSRLSEDSAEKYADMFANKEIDLTTKLVGEDGQELEYSFKDIYMGTYDTVEAANEVAESLHEWHEAISSANTELSKTSSMMQDIVQKAMVNPDSMNFMSNKLPDDIQTAVNAWENASKAISTLTTAQKNGYMGVQDFYNIVTTASSLMEAAGKQFEVAGMNAGELMLKGAQNVKIVDGQLTVDLSSAGMNIVGDVNSLKENMTDGVQELAKAEIAIIDAEIQVLEILAAMEQLSDMDVDVNSNGINFEVGDIFDPKGPDGFSQDMKDYTTALLNMCKTNKELESALQQVKINNQTLYDLLQADANTWIETFGSKENVSKFWQNFSEGMEGWDLEGNLQEQVLNFFKGLNSELTVDLGDSGVFHIGVNGAVWSIDFTNEQLMKDAEAAAKKFNLLQTGEDIKDKIKAILAKQQTEGTLDLGETFTLHVANGTITLVTDDDGNTRYKVGNNTYSDAQLASAVADLTKIGATITDTVDLNEDPEFSSLTDGTLNGKLKIGSFEVDVESAGEGVTYTKDGYTANSLDDLYAKLYLKEQDATQDSITDVLEYKKWQVKQGILVETIFEVNGQESDPNKNENLRKAIQDYLTGNKPITKTDITTGENGATVTLEEGITLTIPENKVQLNFEKDGSLTQKSAEQLQSYLREITGVDLGLKDTISQAITEAFTNISSQLTLLNATEPTGLTAWSGALSSMADAISKTSAAVENLVTALEKLSQLNAPTGSTPTTFTADGEQAQGEAEKTKQQLSDIPDKTETEITADGSQAQAEADETKGKLDAIPIDIDINISASDNASDAINKVAEAIENLKDKTVNVIVKETIAKAKGNSNNDNTSGSDNSKPNFVKAAGNVGYAHASGTLMGELGPEIYVQNGRYYVAGQNGPEFVDLAEDAIVFNHLQTEQLLKKGMSSTRGRAVTNERTAVAFAQGNINGGPAMASASAALAALKRLRSMWESLMNASVQDLAGAGGAGGGGGGGGKGANAAFVKELEKWYNWLQKIAELEEKINYQEQLRSTISSGQKKNGAAYYASLKDSLKNLQEQVKTEQSLVDSQQTYFDKRRKEMNSNNNPFTSLYTFDEDGQLKYKDGALKKLSDISATDDTGKPKHTVQEQYEEILKLNPDFAKYMKYDSSGNKIEYDENGKPKDESAYASAVQAFWDKIDADKEEMQSLHDSINEHKEAVLAAQEKQNEIIQEMRDNQLAVEKDVYNAIVDARERAIEDAEAERDAIEESTSKFIDGLSNALDKERSMYEMQQSQNDLDQKRRRLAILQRTGGSNSEIASLQSDIASSERELYFDKQQEQIDLIQEASDKQIEKLDQQIELDKEMLEYQKEHGLLWGEVAEIMKMDSAAIVDFITSNNSEWWGKSPVQSAQDLEDAIFKADNWVNFRDDQNSWYESIINAIYAGTTSAAPSNPTESDDSVTHTGGTDNDNKATVTYEKYNAKKHWKITTKKDKNGKEKTSKVKEEHKFNKKGKCKKCGYEKVTSSDDDNDSKIPTDNGNPPSTDDGNAPSASDAPSSGGTGTLVCVAKNGSTVIARQSHIVSVGTIYAKDYKPTVQSKWKYESASPTSVEMTNGGNMTITYKYTLKQDNNSDPNYVPMSSQQPSAQPEKAFKNGGLIDYTGPAWVDGSPKKPEGILNAKQTSFLRNQILGNSPTSLMSLLTDYQAGIARSSNLYTTIDRDKSTQIGSISLNMDVKQIANDYDAKRAGEKAMEEMLRIARKSTTATIRR